MNNYISDVELAGQAIFLSIMWNSFDNHAERKTALFGALCFMDIKATEYKDIGFLFNYCSAVNHE